MNPPRHFPFGHAPVEIHAPVLPPERAGEHFLRPPAPLPLQAECVTQPINQGPARPTLPFERAPSRALSPTEVLPPSPAPPSRPSRWTVTYPGRYLAISGFVGAF